MSSSLPPPRESTTPVTGVPTESLGIIEYAPDGLDAREVRLLRAIVAVTAIVYGGNALLAQGIHLALTRGWVASLSSTRWIIEGGATTVVWAADGLNMLLMLIGGVLLWRRMRSSILILRISIACTVVLLVAGIVVEMIANPTYASFWSTPASAAYNALQYPLSYMLVPILLALLTLPPLARRMVG